MKRVLLASGAIATLGIAGLIGVASVSAVSDSSAGGVDTLVTKIAEKFNLNKDDVQKVFDEERAVRIAEREQVMKDRLARAVTNGDLTQDQADMIVAKHQEMREFMEGLADKTADERRAAMQQKRGELNQWASDNNIPLRYLRLKGGHHGGHGYGGRGMHHDTAPDSETAEN